MKTRVIARIFIKQESIEAFRTQAALLIPKTRAEKGCLFYSLFEDVASPGEFLFYEEYVDRTALDVHSKSEYLQNFRTAIKGMHAKDKIVDVV